MNDDPTRHDDLRAQESVIPEPWVSSASPPYPQDALPAAPPRRRGAIVITAAVSALVGALVAGLIVAADDDDSKQSRSFGPNSSVITRRGDVQEILSKVEPSVVAIRTSTLSVNFFFEPVPSEGAGTGFVISPDGLVLTNSHVLNGARTIEVELQDGAAHSATIVGRDRSHDLALLKIDASGLPSVKLGDSDKLQVGDDVIAIGNALALDGGPTVTRGIVSAKDRTIQTEDGTRLRSLLQTDTAINPGNSGGPLVDAAGEVVGINTAIAGEAQNIGFAISISSAKPVIDELRKGTIRSQALLGVVPANVTAQVARQFELTVESGAVVVDVSAESGAERAGIKPGDVIVEIDGSAVASADDVFKAIDRRRPGDTVTIVLVRGRDRMTVKADLGERPEPTDTGN